MPLTSYLTCAIPTWSVYRRSDIWANDYEFLPKLCRKLYILGFFTLYRAFVDLLDGDDAELQAAIQQSLLDVGYVMHEVLSTS